MPRHCHAKLVHWHFLRTCKQNSGNRNLLNVSDDVRMLLGRKGFAIGCTEGRVALEYFDELANKTSGGKQLHLLSYTMMILVADVRIGVVMSPNAARSPTIKRKNFTFKCHRYTI